MKNFVLFRAFALKIHRLDKKGWQRLFFFEYSTAKKINDEKQKKEINKNKLLKINRYGRVV